MASVTPFESTHESLRNSIFFLRLPVTPTEAMRSQASMDQLTAHLEMMFTGVMLQGKMEDPIQNLMESAQKDFKTEEERQRFVITAFTQFAQHVFTDPRDNLMKDAMLQSLKDLIIGIRALEHRHTRVPFRMGLPEGPDDLRNPENWPAETAHLYQKFASTLHQCNLSPLVFSLYALSLVLKQIPSAELRDIQIHLASETLNLMFPHRYTDAEEERRHLALRTLVPSILDLFNVAAVGNIVLDTTKVNPSQSSCCVLQ